MKPRDVLLSFNSSRKNIKLANLELMSRLMRMEQGGKNKQHDPNERVNNKRK